MIARLEITKGKLVRTGFLPLYIGRDAVPHIVEQGSAEYDAVVDYMTAVTGEAGLNARYAPKADMVEISA